MPQFAYEAVDTRGASQVGEIDAPDEAQAYVQLKGLGLTIVALRDTSRSIGKELPWYRRDISLGGGGLSLAAQADLADHLAILFRARLPLTDILNIVARSTERGATRDLFLRIGALVADGMSLADAFDLAGGKASPLFRSLLGLSSEAAESAELLENYARFLRREARTRSKIVGAMVYPMILIAGAFGVLVLVALFLAPNLAPMFEALNKPIPKTIAAFLVLGEWLRGYGWLLAALLAALLIASALVWRQAGFREFRHAFVTNLPFIGDVVRFGELARITRATDLLLRSGRDLPTAFRQSAASFGHRGAAHSFRAAAEALQEGRTASEVFDADASLPILFRELFRAGEQANMLRAVLPTIGENLENLVERRTESGVRLLAPVLTLVLGGAIGLLVYSIMSAILSVNEVVF